MVNIYLLVDKETMDKKINKRIENYTTQFKDNIREQAIQLDICDNEKTQKLLQFIYDYERLHLSKEDFMKRKRIKNSINLFDRCCAKRANNEQCTRRKKGEEEYCGTHLKGTPHGIIELNKSDNNNMEIKKIEVWAQDIQGIIYYIDNLNNVYQTEDIIINKTNPKVIAKYEKIGENYKIPAFGL